MLRRRTLCGRRNQIAQYRHQTAGIKPLVASLRHRSIDRNVSTLLDGGAHIHSEGMQASKKIFPVWFGRQDEAGVAGLERGPDEPRHVSYKHLIIAVKLDLVAIADRRTQRWNGACKLWNFTRFGTALHQKTCRVEPAYARTDKPLTAKNRPYAPQKFGCTFRFEDVPMCADAQRFLRYPWRAVLTHVQDL